LSGSRVLIIGVVALVTGVCLVISVIGMLVPQQATGPVPVTLAPAQAVPARPELELSGPPNGTPPARPTPQAPARPTAERKETISLPTAAQQQARAPKVDDDAASGRAQREMASRLCSKYGVSC
jgi:hypothetical protein